MCVRGDDVIGGRNERVIPSRMKEAQKEIEDTQISGPSTLSNPKQPHEGSSREERKGNKLRRETKGRTFGTRYFFLSNCAISESLTFSQITWVGAKRGAWL